MNFDSCVVRTISYSPGGNAIANFMPVALYKLASLGIQWSSANSLVTMSLASL